jgi:tetratricopeptide (TPR) repeat protein
MKTVVTGTRLLLALLVIAPATASGGQAPPPASPQQLYEAGQYDQVIQRVGELRAAGGAGLREAFLAAHARVRQNLNDPAKAEFALLIASTDAIWRLVGESSIAAVDNDVDRALNLATEAVNAVNGLQASAAAAAAAGAAPPAPPDAIRDFHALYQLGLARTRKDDWAGALDAFERATTLDPGFAYGHYYAGLAASRVQRPDRVAVHFGQFLQLAPNAPEHSAVMSIMRTLRGF